MIWVMMMVMVVMAMAMTVMMWSRVKNPLQRRSVTNKKE